MNENKDNKEENQPLTGQPGNLPVSPVGASQDDIPALAAPTYQKTKEMEVHHHGHVPEKKKWKEYIFQFFMLLLAVFLGSYAETKREELVEKHREKDYMESMTQDLKKDTASINEKYSFIFEQVQKIDSIQVLFFSADLKNNPTAIFKCYQLSGYLFWYATLVFNERTFSQLIGSGNMRIVREKGAADSIMGYYNAIKTIEQQKQQYITYINLTLGAMYKVYDFSYLRQQLNTQDSTLIWANSNWQDLHLRTTDPDALKDLGSTLENTKLVINNYMQQLHYIHQIANRLLFFLQEKYNIKPAKD